MVGHMEMGVLVKIVTLVLSVHQASVQTVVNAI